MRLQLVLFVIVLHREQIQLCVDILDLILMALSPVHLVQNYRVELHGGLTHPDDTVKILALTQVGFSLSLSPYVPPPITAKVSHHLPQLLRGSMHSPPLPLWYTVAFITVQSVSVPDWQNGGASRRRQRNPQ